jgi:nitronate monooxygenase
MIESMKELIERLSPKIIQGGMGVGISGSRLASAVANEGGVGVIAAAMVGIDEPDIISNPIEANIRALRNEIRKAREMTKGILGVNIMVALTNFSDLVKTSIEEGIDIIISGAGLPLDLPKYLKEGCKTKLVPIVSSGRAAKILCTKWMQRFNCLPDAFVVEGPKAGGHLGFDAENLEKPEFSLENLLLDVIEAVGAFCEKGKNAIPVIPAGGIYTGSDIRKFLNLGASAVQMATRFVTTSECDADVEFKRTYIDAEKKDIVIIKSPVGMPGRAINNQFLEEVKKGKKQPFQCPYQCIKSCFMKNSPYCIARALKNAKLGRFHYGFAFAGANAYLAEKIISVKELMATLQKELQEA